MFTDEEVRKKGMDALMGTLGFIDSQRFISLIIKDSGDYTMLRRTLYDDMTADDVFKMASQYMKEHPLSPDTKARLENHKE